MEKGKNVACFIFKVVLSLAAIMWASLIILFAEIRVNI